jgi:sortase A
LSGSRAALPYRAELFFRIGGAILLAIFGYKIARYAAFQLEPELFLSLPRLSPPPAILAGRLEIPRLKLSVAVLEGESEESLSLGAGHLRDTAPLGGAGNCVIAGHRDSVFRALRHIRIGDRILIHAVRNAAYRVTNIRTVAPDNLSVLRGGSTAKLTLITCYPFYYVGSAPRRYVVEARWVSNED